MELSLWFQTRFSFKSSCSPNCQEPGSPHCLVRNTQRDGQQRSTGRRKRKQKERERRRKRQTAEEPTQQWGKRRKGAPRKWEREEERASTFWVSMEEWMGVEWKTCHQCIRDALWNSASHLSPVPWLPARWPQAEVTVLWPSSKWALPGPQSGLLWCHSVFLPVGREASEASQHTPGHLHGRADVLRARTGHRKPFQGGRRFSKRGREAAAIQRNSEKTVDAVWAPWVLIGRTYHSHHQRYGHCGVHPHLLPGDTTRLQAWEGDARGRMYDWNVAVGLRGRII